MDYEIKTIELRNQKHLRKRLVIEFKNPSLAILATFLMVDAPLLNWRILADIEAIINKEKSTIQSTGNRTTITVTEEITTIEDALTDLMDEDAVLETVHLKTTEFNEVLKEWHQRIKNEV